MANNMASEDTSGVIVWPSLCGTPDTLGVFWDDSLTINTQNPDLTDCFQDTVLVWVPCFILWFGTPFYVWWLSGERYRQPRYSFSCMNACKMVLMLLLMLVTMMDLIEAGADSTAVPASRWLGNCIYIATIVLCMVLTRFEFRKGIHSSGLLFCFWLLSMIASTITLYSQFIRIDQQIGHYKFILGLSAIGFALTFVQFSLHLFSDYGALQVPGHKGKSKDDETKPLLPKEDTRTDENNPDLFVKPSPGLWASFLSRVTFVWISPLLLVGYKRQLDGSKLWDLNPEDRAPSLLRTFYYNWLGCSRDKNRDQMEKDGSGYQTRPHRKSSVSSAQHATWKTNTSLYKTLWHSFGPYYALIGIFELGNTILTFIRPLLQDGLIGYVDNPTAYAWQGYVYIIALFAVTILRGIVAQQHFEGKILVSMRVRSALTAAVYRKTLLLANSVRRDYSVGEIVNLMAVDTQRVSECAFSLHNIWGAPLNIIVAMVLLWQYLGPASLAGLVVLLIMVGGNLVLMNKVRALQSSVMTHKDKRTKLTSEILNGIKVLKLYAWEEAFQAKIEEIRAKELNVIKKAALYFCGTVVTFSCSPVLFAVVAFTVYTLTSSGGFLSAQVAFVSLSLLSSLTRPLSVLPNGIANVVQGQVSAQRLEDFLNSDELDPSIIRRDCDDDNAVQMKDASFSWGGRGEPSVIHNVDLNVKKGGFTCVVGQVGAGKSSLLSAILGELYQSNGELARHGDVAYVSQEAWIRNETLEKNILFGKKINRGRYEQTLDACALRHDIQMLPAGYQTEIGEKGINLSGGQKQRISLARAVYADSDIYLLDDPLSAVDAHVGKHIFNEVIGPAGQLKDKTRILVTHGLTYLSKADQIVVLKDGRISEVGPYQTLIKKDGDFADFIRTYLIEHTAEDSEEEEDIDNEERELRQELERQLSDLPSSATFSLSQSGKLKRRLSRQKSQHGALKDDVKKGDGNKKLIDAETTQTGGVKTTVLVEYMRAIGWGLVFVIIFSGILQIASDLMGNIWLSMWSEDEELQATNQSYTDPDVRVGVYGALGGFSAVVVAIQTISTAIACTVASRVMHEQLLDRILRAPMAFFDTTPIGRILNRFSQDMNVVDVNVRMTLIAVFRGVTSLVGTMIAITYTTPIFLTALVPISIGYYFLQRFYIVTSNQLRRIMSIRTSPMYSHFGETVAGASSVRAYRLQADFIQESDRRLDDMQKAKYPSIIMDRWLTVWLEVLGSFVVLFAGLFAIFGKDSISGGLVGLSISYALQVTDRLAMFLRNTSDLENNVVSLERIQEYSQVDQEAPWSIPENEPRDSWPAEGSIEFCSFSMRYRPGLDLVLRNLQCNIQSREKIGIVGRTGAGKSSMTVALFRLIEAAAGSIVIDDVDTSNLGLHALRSKLTIIPQDPTLFSGTLRFNLDPLNLRTDVDVWDALGHAHLRQFVAQLSEGLNYECTEGGSNLSVGQRQLVCLARALLRKTKVLILDEATAAIDMETDKLIQDTIRREFAECTVLTVAHRINTVMDYDRVMVLHGGEIREFDAPTRLLDNPHSMFSDMCRDAGVTNTEDQDS